MLAISPNTRCFVCIEPQDFRKGIDGMSAVVRQKVLHDPMSGAVYLFRSQNRRSIKVLFYGGLGYWLCQLRLSSGRLKWWPKQGEDPHSLICALGAREVLVMLANGDPMSAQFDPEWKKLT